MMPVALCPEGLRNEARAALLGTALVASLAMAPQAWATPPGDLAALAAQVAELEERLALVEGEQASTQKSLREVAARLEALGRASQTADLRLDLEALRRQVEALSQGGGSPAIHEPLPPPARTPENPASVSGAASVPAPSTIGSSPGQEKTGEPRGATPHPTAGGPYGEDLYSQAHRDYIAGRYDEAAEGFQAFAGDNPSHPKAPNALYWVGECLYSQKRFSEARTAFGEVLQRYPEGPKARAAELKVGFCQLAEGNPEGAREVFLRVAKSYPGTDEAQIAKERLSRLEAP